MTGGGATAVTNEVSIQSCMPGALSLKSVGIARSTVGPLAQGFLVPRAATDLLKSVHSCHLRDSDPEVTLQRGPLDRLQCVLWTLHAVQFPAPY